jgi:hypothetical protein
MGRAASDHEDRHRHAQKTASCSTHRLRYTPPRRWSSPVFECHSRSRNADSYPCSLYEDGASADRWVCGGDLRDLRGGSISAPPCSRDPSRRDTYIRRSASGRHSVVWPTTPDGAENSDLCAHSRRGWQAADVPLCLEQHARPFICRSSAASGHRNVQAALSPLARGTFRRCECVSCPVWGVCQVDLGALCL